MRSLFAVAFGSLAFFLLSAITFAQGMPEIPERAPILGEKTEEQRYEEQIRTSESLGLVAREDRVLKKGLLAPSEADRLAFATFLRPRNTGLIRLLPREIYDSGVKPNSNPAKMRGGGSYYSFTNLSHAYGHGSDIGLERGYLMVGFAGAAYGMLTNIGDVSIDNITVTDPRVQFLATYKPPSLEHEARAEGRRFWSKSGVMIDGLSYQRRIPVHDSTTYLLRSIDYGQTDVLVTFRVVRKDPDGSLIIAWKLLKSFPPTKLMQGK